MLNVIPWRAEQLIRRKQMIFFMTIFICCLTIACFALLRCYFKYKTTQLLATNELLRDEFRKKENLKETKSRILQKQIHLLQTQVILDRQQKLISLLQNITRDLPGNSYLNQMIYDQDGLSLEGVLLSSNQTSLDKFYSKIAKENNAVIKNRHIQLNTDKKFTFGLYIKLGTNNEPGKILP